MKIKLLTFYFFIIALCALPMGCFKKQAPSVDTTNLQNTTQAPINTNNLDQLHQMVDGLKHNSRNFLCNYYTSS